MCISNILTKLDIVDNIRISFHALKQQEDKTPQIQGTFKKSILVCSYNTENAIGSNILIQRVRQP